MSNIHQLKRRISTAKNISKITKAMEMVAASKMKRAQDQALSSRPYARALIDSLKMVAKNTESSLHPLLETHETGLDVAIIISTDKGLCGALNTNLLKATNQWSKQHPNSVVVAVGKKAINFARTYGFTLHAQFVDLPDIVTTADLLPITTLVIEGFMQYTFRSVHLIYTDFINTLSQQVTIGQLLPLVETEIEDKTMIESLFEPMYLFEPTPQEILEELLPYYVENAVFQALLEGKASEHSARMVAMKNASENAGELVDELRLMFNKSRQESITRELLEITTATMTLSS